MTGVFPGIDEPRPHPTWIDQPAAAPSKRALSRSSKLILGLVLVAAVTLVVLKPVGVFGVDADSLSTSFNSAIGHRFADADCKQTGPYSYRCQAVDPAGIDADVVYRVGAGQTGCWSALSTDSRKDLGAAPRNVGGCVGLGDILRNLP